MNTKTQEMMNQIVAHARTGAEVYPMMFQPIVGRSNVVSAAIRAAKKAGLIEQSGTDGLGKPKYRAVFNTTHTAPTAIQ